MANSISKENKMGIMPVNKLLVSMSIPMVIAMLVQALYNVIDSLFVAQISEDCLTAVSLAFPMQNLMIAIASGTGVGINALLSKSLGEGNKKQANSAAINGIFLAFLSFLIFFFVGFLGSEIFFRSQTTDEGIIQYGTQYTKIVTMLSFGLFGVITLERLLQATGLTLLTMYTQGIGAIINIILDPIFIFGLFGFPRMEAAGAALATVVGQIIGFFLALYLNIKRNHELDLHFTAFRPDFSTIKKIYAVGIPSIIMASISSVMIYGMNKILIGITQSAATVFGIYYKLQSFVFMPIFGMNNGMVPIIAYNYGARKKERITQTIRLAIYYATGIMAIGFFLFEFFPVPLLKMFNASDTLLVIGVPALRIICIHFLFAGASIIFSSVFQATGNGNMSLIVSLIRQLVVLLPVAFLLSFLHLDAIWFSFPIAEVVSLMLCIFFMKKTYRTKIAPLENGILKD